MTDIVDIKPAGDDHQVVSVSGENSGFMKKPCIKCPWRKDATGEFPAEAFRHSAETAYDMSTRLFGCHESGAEKLKPCAGFILNGSEHNLSVRIHLAKRTFDLNSISDGGHDLWESYRAMAIANGVEPDDPVLERCRP